MPTMNIHVTGLEEVRRSLGRLAPAANDIMKTAINETAKAARGDLVAKARRTYMVKAGSFNKSMKLKRATKNSLTAVLHSRGKPIPLRGFVYTKHNVATGDPAAAHQIRGRRNFPCRGWKKSLLCPDAAGAYWYLCENCWFCRNGRNKGTVEEKPKRKMGTAGAQNQE